MEDSIYNGQSQSLFSHVADTVESQSTQLLDFVLGRTTAAAPTKAWNDTSAKGTPSSSGSAHGNKTDAGAKDASVGSGSTDASLASSVHYHLHGLAETQTQSQFPEAIELSHDGEAEEGGSESQKENTPTHVLNVPKTPTPPTIPLGSSGNGENKKGTEAKIGATAFCVKDDKDKAPSPLPLTPSRPLSTRVPPQAPQTKVVSFLSPLNRPSPKPDKVQKPTVSTPAPMRFRRRARQQRSPSPASQDSFAGPNPLEDPDLFVATSRQFEIPIDQIGLPDSQEEEAVQEEVQKAEEQVQDTHSHVEESPLKDEESKKHMRPPGRSVSQMTPYSLSSASSNRFDRILVANSDSSGPSQDSNEGNISMQMSQQPTQALEDSITTSMIAQVDEDEVQDGDETQIIDDTTQPSELVPSGDVRHASNIQRTSTAGTVGSTFAPSTATSVASGPRSLLSSIAPEKRHRYAHIEPPREYTTGSGSPFVPPSLQGGNRNAHTIAGTLGTGPESTRRSTVSGASNAATAGTSVASVARVPASAANLSSANNAQVQGLNRPAISVGVKRPMRSDYDEDVVPDSEAQVEEQLSSQGDKRPASTEANKKRKLDVIPESEPDVSTSLPPKTTSKAIDNDEELTEEESEEEEPLAKQRSPVKKVQPTHPAQVKGKQKELAAPPAAGRSRVAVAPAGTIKQEKKLFPAPPPAVPLGITKTKRAAAQQLEVIPSSEPQTDEIPARRKPGRPRKADADKGNGKAPASAPPAPQQQRTASPAARRMRGGARASTYEPPSPAIPLANHARTEEERTEIADDEHMDIDDGQTMDGYENEEDYDEVKSETAVAAPAPPPVPMPSPELVHDEPPRKRARGAAAAIAAPPVPTASGKKKTTKKAAGSNRRTTRNMAATATTNKAGPSATKRAAKNTIATGKGTRVLALWKSDASWYIGTVHSVVGDRYKVKFDDGTDDELIISHMRRASDIRVGDILNPVGYNATARVTNIDTWDSRSSLQAILLEGEDEGTEIDIQAADVKIAHRTVSGHWNDRKLEQEEIIPTVGRKLLKESPSPSKMSMISGMSGAVARNKLFSRCGFVITLGPHNNNYEQDRARIVKTINDYGGTVISDWGDILAFQGKHTKGDKRWTIQASDIKLNQPKGVDRVFLISDQFTQKPKYLIALALGVPCVSEEWLEAVADGAEMESSWASYLLPAGFSDSIEARISQLVDLDWGSSPLHLQDIMTNPVSIKVLSDANVLCLGPDLLPPKKPPTDASRGAPFAVPRIIACMGAKRVEAVASAEHASERDLSKYDFVVVKDSPPSHLVGDPEVVCVNVAWIKDCLFTGRQLPKPVFT